MMQRRSVTDFLTSFSLLGDEIAYIQRRGYRTVRWSYKQVADNTFRFARELQNRGIKKGDRILLWGPNSAEWVAAFFGIALVGVVVPIDYISEPDFVQRVFQQVDAKLLVCSSDRRPAWAANVLALDTLIETVAGHSWEPLPENNISLDDTLEIVFTSGTTAEPKGVVITHGNVLANVAPLEIEIRKYLKYERLVHPIRFLNLLPLSHVFGQFLGMFLPPLMGGTVVFQDDLKPAEVIRTIHRERVSVLVAVPRILETLREKIVRDLEGENRLPDYHDRFNSAKEKHFLRRWWIFRDIRRMFGWKFWAFICGGAALDEETEEFWRRLGYAVIQGYGLTETTSLISVNHPFRLGKGSIGKVLAGREVKLASDGEILVRGGGVSRGYWGKQELQPIAAEGAGWYRTGDIGELDEQGNLYFKGRTKDVIVTPAGMKVYPSDLEAALRRQPEVKDCVVLDLPINGNAEPCAILILRDKSKNPETIVKRANESLAEYQRMRIWRLWPDQDFPRTSTQKPRKNVIREIVLSGSQQVDRKFSSPLADLIEHVTGRSTPAILADSDLEKDLNLSSMDRVALLGALEDRYQLDLSDTAASAVTTIADLQRVIQGEPAPRTTYHYPAWTQRWPVTWVRRAIHLLLLRPAVFLLAKPRIQGRENVANIRGPVLVISNHIDDVDPGFILTALPGRFRHKLAIATGGTALEALRTPPKSRNWWQKLYDRIRWFLGVSLLNLFPLSSDAGFRQSFAYAGESVDRGYSVLVFPEGHHTTDGKLLPFRPGIGILASRLGIPVLPMRIDGLFELKQAGKKLALPGKVHVKIGFPIKFGIAEDPEKIAKELQKKVEEL